MKRMYVVLFILCGVIFWAGTLLGQQGSRPIDDHDDKFMQKRLQLREEMHRRLMDKILKGTGPDQDMFSDMESMMDEVMKDSFTGFSGLTSPQSNFSMEWLETSSGKTLVITPKDPKQNLDINVSNGMITINGKVENKTSHGVSISNFSNNFSVPQDCDPEKVKMDQKDGKILVQFPYRVAKSSERKLKNQRTPVPPSKDDIQI